MRWLKKLLRSGRAPSTTEETSPSLDQRTPVSLNVPREPKSASAVGARPALSGDPPSPATVPQKLSATHGHRTDAEGILNDLLQSVNRYPRIRVRYVCFNNTKTLWEVAERMIAAQARKDLPNQLELVVITGTIPDEKARMMEDTGVALILDKSP